MEKNKKVAAGDLLEMLSTGGEDIVPQTETVTWNGFDITIRDTISLRDAISFVGEVVDMSFLEDGTYVPEMTDFAVRVGVLSHYTDIELPENIEDQYTLVYVLPLFSQVIHHINMAQYNVLCDAAYRKVEMQCDADVNEVRSGIEKLLSALEGLEKKMEGAFGGVDSADVAKLASALGSSEIDEEKIVNAMLKQSKPKAKKKKA